MSSLKKYLKKVCSFSANARNFLVMISLNFINLGAIQVILGLYILQLGYSEEFFGTVAAARILATGLMAIPAGIVSRKVGVKKLLMFASLLTGSTLIVQGFITGKYLILLANYIYGTGFAVIFVNIGPFLSQNSSKYERDQLFSLNFVLMTAAKMLGTLLVAVLPGFYLSTIIPGNIINIETYRYILITLGFITLLAVIPVLLIKETPVRENKNSDKDNSVYENLKQENISRLGLYKFLLGAGGGLIGPFFSIFLTKHLEITAGRAGFIMFLYRLTIAIALLLTPIFTRKLGKVKSVGIFQMSSLPFLLAIVLIPNFAIVSVTFLIRGALMGMTRPIASNFSMEIVPESRQTITSSIMRTSKSIARSGTATMGGWVIANYGFTPTYILTFILYLGGAFLFVGSFSKTESTTAN